MHGPETTARTALVVVDVINSYDHAGSEALARSAEACVPVIATSIEAARARGIDVIYANDNRGRWGEGREEQVARALAGEHPELVAPDDGDRYLVKMRHSAFFATPLEHILRERGVSRIVICGQVTEQCVLYTAIDAYMRDLAIAVPRDAVAHIDPRQAEAALDLIASNMGGDCREAAAALQFSEA